jgi:hypothetical protein
MSRWPSVLKWYEPVARMRGDRPQGHVGACSDAQANTTFEISGLVPRYGRVQRAVARATLKLLVRMVQFRSASVPAYQRFSAGGRTTVVQPRCQRPLGRDPMPAGSRWEGMQLGATPRVIPLRRPADQPLLAGAGPRSLGSTYNRRIG